MKIIFLILFLSIFLISCTNTSSVCTKNTCFDVEIANTFEERQQGLMNRDNLEQDKGMLFIFQNEGKYAFWMKNTLIPLDIIWFDNNQEVIFINENTPPCKTQECPSYGPEEFSKYVLEINAGLVKAHNIKVGDKIELNLADEAVLGHE